MTQPSPKIIDGKAFAAKLRQQIADKVAVVKDRHGLHPGLAVVLVGEDPASQVYVRNKGRQTLEVGMQSFEFKLAADTDQSALLDLIATLNGRDDVHGILVQLPLPNHIQEQAVIEAIAPEKDVDGFHPMNVGRLATGQPALTPCTPLGCLMLLQDRLGDLSGKHAVVVGRSNIVGKPMAQLLLGAHCTVTIAHSRTQALAAECARADIVIAAVGRPQMIGSDFIGDGATVIDVGINRIAKEEGEGTRLVGDVDFQAVFEKVAGITPVPGGVGPMTIACLLQNTLTAACRQKNIDLEGLT